MDLTIPIRAHPADLEPSPPPPKTLPGVPWAAGASQIPFPLKPQPAFLTLARVDTARCLAILLEALHHLPSSSSLGPVKFPLRRLVLSLAPSLSPEALKGSPRTPPVLMQGFSGPSPLLRRSHPPPRAARPRCFLVLPFTATPQRRP